MRSAIVGITLVVAATQALAQSPQPKQHVIIETPSAIKWGPAPAVLPAGARAALLEGNPAEAGPFTLRLSLPANYRLPPHYHPVTEHVTVIKGAFFVGMGDSFDASKVTELPTGTFAAIEPGMRHYALTKSDAIIQLHGVGPWQLVYVNPSDDPRKKP